MMNKLKPAAIAGLLLIALVLYSGCAAWRSPALDQVETIVHQEDSFHLTLPASWLALEVGEQEAGEQEAGNQEAGEQAVVCAFETEDGLLQLQILEEWGGMEYYSLDEVGDILCEGLSQALFDGQAEQQQANSPYFYCSTIRGRDEQGADLVCHVDVLAPYASVRYYLIYTAAADSYAQNERIIRDVPPTFTMDRGAEEIYQIIQAQRAAAAESAKQEEGAE